MQSDSRQAKLKFVGSMIYEDGNLRSDNSVRFLIQQPLKLSSKESTSPEQIVSFMNLQKKSLSLHNQEPKLSAKKVIRNNS